MNKSQTPAEGILKRNNWGDSMWYRVECQCGNPECAHEFEVEANSSGEIDVTLYLDVCTPPVREYEYSWWSDGILSKIRTDMANLWHVSKFRVATALRVLITGYVRTETSLSMTEQQAINYAATLEQAVAHVSEFRTTQQTQAANQDPGGD